MKHSFPAVKGSQNHNTYYLATMTYGEVATMLKLPEDRYWNSRIFGGGLSMQRELNWKRVRGEMKQYLLENEDPFFSALALIIIPPTLRPLVPGEDFVFRAYKTEVGSEMPVGILELQGSLVLFPADGAHRSAAIMEALEIDPEMADEEIPVVLLPFEGEEKVKQFFADLNLYAKSPSRSLGLDFERREPVAIIAKRLMDLVPLFKDRVNVRTNSLSASSEKVIAMNTLHAATKEIVKALEDGRYDEVMGELRGAAADSPEITEVAQEVAAVWQAAIDSLPEWGAVLKDTKHPRDMRDEYIFAHGLGWQVIARVAASMIEADPSDWEQVLRKTLARLDWSRNNPDWQGLAMAGNRVNNTAAGINATTGYVLFQAGYRADESTPAGDPVKPYLDAFKRARPDLVPEAQAPELIGQA